MSLSTFIKLVTKAFKFTLSRPIQRFNIYNRVKPILEPESDQFLPAPRAIGPMGNNKPKQYPHLDGTTRGMFKSVKQKRLAAIEKMKELKSSKQEIKYLPTEKSFSESKLDDIIVIEAANKFQVKKTVAVLKSPEIGMREDRKLITDGNEGDRANSTQLRPLPKSVNLDMSDPRIIWQVNKVPPGKISLDQFQEIMINKLADEFYWTPKAIAEKYNIKEDYASKLIENYKQIKIILSPRMFKAVEYVGRNDPVYQGTKHIVYKVDRNLRTDFDRQCDKMYLPEDEIDPEIRELIQPPSIAIVEDKPKMEIQIEKVFYKPKKIPKKPEPLRIEPLNRPPIQKKLPKESKPLLTATEASSKPKKMKPPSSSSSSPPAPPPSQPPNNKQQTRDTK